MQSPAAMVPRGDWHKTHEWAHGLCGCFDNMGICLMAFIAPCVSFGQTAETLGKSCCIYGWLFAVPFLNCLLEVQQRLEIRNIRDIPGSFLGDLLLVSLCTPCTLAQEAQEVELLQAQERAAAAGVTLPVPGVGPGHVDVVVTSAPYSSNMDQDDNYETRHSEYQPAYTPPRGDQTHHNNQMVAGLDFSPPSVATEEAEISRD